MNTGLKCPQNKNVSVPSELLKLHKISMKFSTIDKELKKICMPSAFHVLSHLLSTAYKQTEHCRSVVRPVSQAS